MKILVTGASGFIGKKACKYLSNIGHEVLAFSRTSCNLPKNITLIKGDTLLKVFSETQSLKGLDCIIHLAGRTYTSSNKTLSYSEYFKDNVQETLDLANISARANVKRFIFISSIKVNGESTNKSSPFNESDVPNPQDYYALSKHQAELGLLNISKQTNLEVVIIRPPLVYGVDAKGYFGLILKIIKLNIPLPFGYFKNNRRSFLYVDNLLNFLATVIKHPKAANNIFLCSDCDDISTANLLKNLYLGMYTKNSLLKVPKFLVSFFLYFIGKRKIYKKLSESLIVDCSKSSKILDWNPPIKANIALQKVARNYYLKN